ncbi:DegT/DnrJ/EryC1/StrS family aminotransferase [Paenibacillus piscarius]|uniref:DegT/DnrJ/EryC1/StrS family aminotransferase n=1 Tax=Paenibacillus piscarius TaxID=1089681 RepID=UPI001EE87C4B|nr:DegT/DnrJ/EryC1/StrS family aminotransferase [Paenibacillus piscarius]
MYASKRDQIMELTATYYKEQRPEHSFRPGLDMIPASGKTFDEQELVSLMNASLDYSLSEGDQAARFERQLAITLGARFSLLVNSGTSANILALSALTSPYLGARQLQPGDEVITIANKFPSTIIPIMQHGLVPVFTDVTIPSYAIETELLDRMVTHRTKAVMVAHTMGNPFNIAYMKEFADRHGLWLIEDASDALGSMYQGQPVGSFGDLATVSFFPGQQITMEEGGAVLTSSSLLKQIVESLRDAGKASPYANQQTGVNHSMGFQQLAANLYGAIGLTQLRKLAGFTRKRRENFKLLYQALEPLQYALHLPEETPGSEPSWLGFPVIVKEHSPIGRNELIRSLEEGGIGTRLVFPGPSLRQFGLTAGSYRLAGPLHNTETIRERSFWIGLHPGLTEEMLSYSASAFHKIFTM